jgi:TolB-like protein
LTVYRFNGFELDPARRCLRAADGEAVTLTAKIFDTLLYFVEHRGRVIGKDTLLAAIWPSAVVDENNLAHTISLLRRVLGDDAKVQRCIATVAGRGYQFVADVDVLGSPAASRAAECDPGLGQVPKPSIAVLPFADLSADKNQEYFADGISEELTNALSRAHGLHVAGRTSAFYFKGKNESLRTIGEALGVEHILEGSVRKARDRMRVTTRLVNATTGYQVWSESYDRPFEDVFVLQDEIARSVARALQVTLGVGAIGSAPGMTRNVAAYEEFLLAQSQRRRSVPEAFPVAIQHLQRALSLDPSFAMAWSALRTVCVTGAYLMPGRAREWRRNAAEALERARRLTPDAPDVLLDTALDFEERRMWSEAGALHERFREAEARLGADGRAATARGRFLLSVGRIREAVEALEVARAIQPLDSEVPVYLCDAYASAGDARSALAELDRGLRIGGGFEPLLRGLGLIVALGERDRGEIDARLAAFPDDDPGAELNRRLAQYLDQPVRAVDAIHDLAAAASRRNFVGFIPGVWAAYYGHPQLVIKLARAMSVGALTFWRPLMRDVRKQPEFKDLLREYGLVDYWRAHQWAECCRPTDDLDFECA